MKAKLRILLQNNFVKKIIRQNRKNLTLFITL